LIYFLALCVLYGLNTQLMSDFDQIDRNILHELESDGRISNADLSRRVGLSPSASLRRVQELERTGVITGYRAILDRSKLGVAVTVFVMVGLSAHLRTDAKAFERAMTAAPEVRECHNITGSVEYLLRVEVSSLEAFKDFHSNTLGVLPQVASITSHISLGSPKDKRA
jgi:Lrp/AsnC family leucine-responsive transcriptional regulator